MAFEDDMIEAGYSDEEEYLESLFDDFEEDCSRQKDRELEYDNAFDYYDEEEEREHRERLHKREKQKQWINEWKENNADLAIIWKAYFSTISFYADLAHMDNRHFMGLNEHKELKKWLNERTCFESERKKTGWSDKLLELFSLYKNELFKFYFSENEELIKKSLVSQQARELYLIEIHEPLLWKIISSYVVEPKLLKTIEEDAFWNVVYNREMDYEFWRDNNTEKYNDYAKQWVAKNATYVYGEWLSKHKAEEIDWKSNNHNIWERFKKCCEVKERNKFIKSKIEDYNNKGKLKNRNYLLYRLLDSDIDDYLDEDVINEPVLYDFERFDIEPFDLSSISIDIRQFVDDSITALDASIIDRESSKKADELMTQLWVYTNRDEWEMDALKKYNNDLFKNEQKNSQELFNWWKVKYPKEWVNFQTSILPSFKMDFVTVMKFRLWALDGNKEEFFSLGDKYLSYWGKTLKVMYGQDIHDQLCNYFHNESRYQIDFWGEDVDYIKKYTSTSHEVEIWQKELQDKTIWDVIYKGNYHDHYLIESMYTSFK